MVPSRNLTVRAVPVEATAAAASRANAPDKVTDDLSAPQRSLNSRRLSNLVPLLFTPLFLPLRARSEDRSAGLHSASSPRASGCLVKDMAECFASHAQRCPLSGVERTLIDPNMAWFWPKIAAALTSKHHWLIIACDSCGTVVDLDLRVKPRDPEASIG